MQQVMKVLEERAGNQPAHRVLGLSRRQLGLLAGLVGAGAVGLACTSEQLEELLEQIRNRPVRREINSLGPDHRIVQSYAAAVTEMRDLDASDPRNWNNQAAIHAQFCRHASWLFLPWHRAYLLYFEQICRELSGDDDFTLPYWNWTDNPAIPEAFLDTSSSLFHPGRLIGEGSQLPDTTVGEAVVANVLSPSNFILFAGPQVALNAPPTHGPAFGLFEAGPHNGVHVDIGGDLASVANAARDPLFWLHHARVDQLWVQWNVIDEKPNTNHSDWTDTEFTEFSDGNGDPVTVRVSVTTLWPLLTYRYDTQEVA